MCSISRLVIWTPPWQHLVIFHRSSVHQLSSSHQSLPVSSCIQTIFFVDQNNFLRKGKIIYKRIMLDQCKTNEFNCKAWYIFILLLRYLHAAATSVHLISNTKIPFACIYVLQSINTVGDSIDLKICEKQRKKLDLNLTLQNTTSLKSAELGFQFQSGLTLFGNCLIKDYAFRRIQLCDISRLSQFHGELTLKIDFQCNGKSKLLF